MELLQPSSTEQATRALGNGSRALAGGTELVPLLRDGLVKAETLVHISHVVPRGIDGNRIGAGTTLAELEVATQIPQALREACPQGGVAAAALDGDDRRKPPAGYALLVLAAGLRLLAPRRRAVLREGRRAPRARGLRQRAMRIRSSVRHRGRTVALGATLRTTQRELAVADLYRLPTAENRDVTTLAPDELILELDVPQPEASTYLKAMDRRKWSFPIVGVAAARFSTARFELRWPGWLRFPGRSTPPRLSRTPRLFPARPTRSRSPAPSSAARLQR